MNTSGFVGALLPVFFVLALGYLAGKRNAFDADQAAGLSKLAVSFALPAALFVSIMEMRTDLLLQQRRLVLALILAYAGLFFVAWFLLQRVKSLRGTPAIIHRLILLTSATMGAEIVFAYRHLPCWVPQRCWSALSVEISLRPLPEHVKQVTAIGPLGLEYLKSKVDPLERELCCSTRFCSKTH